MKNKVKDLNYPTIINDIVNNTYNFGFMEIELLIEDLKEYLNQCKKVGLLLEVELWQDK